MTQAASPCRKACGSDTRWDNKGIDKSHQSKKTQGRIMDDNKQQKNNRAESFGSLNDIMQFIKYYVAIHHITPEEEEEFRAAQIDVNLPKKGRQEDETLKELKRQSKDKARFINIRKFLHVGIEGKRCDPDSELFKTAKELMDSVDRIESDPSSVGGYEQNRFKTGLIRYKELLLGEREQVELHPQETTGENIFRNEGDFWTVRYNSGDLRHIKNIVGMSYIAQLLDNPNKDISAIKLVKVRNKLTGENPGLSEEEASDEGLAFSKEDVFPSSKNKKGVRKRETHEVTDKEYFEKCRNELDDLKKAKERAEREKNTTEAEVTQHQIDKIMSDLNSSTGLGTRFRKFTDDSEKARSAVNKAISRAYSCLEKENEELWRHLSNSITMGITCSYRPEPKVIWQL